MLVLENEIFTPVKHSSNYIKLPQKMILQVMIYLRVRVLNCLGEGEP